MQGHKIHFADIPLIETLPYSKAKSFTQDRQRIRLVEFKEGFVEPDWCTNGHAGIVMEGACAIDFDGCLEHFEKGDVFMIPKGEEHRHKAVLDKGEEVTLLLFEIAD